MTTTNIINLEAYETLENKFAFLVVFYADKVAKENRIDHKKVTGFDTATAAMVAGYEAAFKGETLSEWNQANYTSNKFKKTFTYIGA